MEASFREDYAALEKTRGPSSGNYVVRPGRLLTCLHAMELNLSLQGRPSDDPVLRRLADIRREAAEILQDLAYK